MNKHFIFLEDLIFVLYYEVLDNNELKLLKWDIDFNKDYDSILNEENDDLKQIEKSFKVAYADWKNKNSNFVPMNIEKFLIKNYTLNQRKIYDALLRTKSGDVFSYQELANSAGFEKGYARFAGTCMARNNYPLMIPCHRIIAKNGKMEAFSASGGVSLKKYLLEVESTDLNKR